MPLVDDCIFCQIATGAEPCHSVFEDERHLGFLDIFPNTEGFSVVITKEHHPSDVATADAEVVAELVQAARLMPTRPPGEASTSRRTPASSRPRS